jgi:hypothetical protein
MEAPMAKYRNDGSVTRILEGGRQVAPGSWGKTVGYAYPVHADFTIIEHDPSPIETLHEDVLPATLTGLAKYGEIIITNDSGLSIAIEFNEDDSHSLTIANGKTYPILQDKEIEKMEITGDGTGNVYVIGMK